jgi:dipeptidyl aminopeptidase/acylaminoacyl peptidase
VFAGNEVVTLSVKDVVESETFGSEPIAVSPDGELIAFTVQRGYARRAASGHYGTWHDGWDLRKGIDCDIWVVNTKSGETRDITGRNESNWGAQWSPDGRYLAFFSDRGGITHLFVWTRQSGKPRQVSDVAVRLYSGSTVLRWFSDSKRVLVRIVPEDMSIHDLARVNGDGSIARERNQVGEASRPSVTVYSSPATFKGSLSSQSSKANGLYSAYISIYAADLAEIDVFSGQVRRLVRRAKPTSCWIAPNDSYVAFTDANQDAGRGSAIYDLVVLRMPDLKTRVAAHDIKQSNQGAGDVSWSPNGKTICFLDLDSSQAVCCCLVSVDSGQLRIVPPPGGQSYDQSPPLWDPEGRSVYLSSGNAIWRVSVEIGETKEVARIADRRLTGVVLASEAGRFWSPAGETSMVVRTYDNHSLMCGFYKIDLATGRFSKLIEGHKSYGSGLPLLASGSRNGQHMFYVCEDAANSADIWIADKDFRDTRRLTQLNPRLDRYVMGSSKIVQWESPSGETLRGALLLPAGYEPGKRYPLVVQLYGGAPLSRHLNLFGLNGSWDRISNMQLLATRGYAVLLADTKARPGNPMRDILTTLMPGIDEVIKMGLADPDELGVMGQSYGGYSVLALIVQTDRFKAAIDLAGPGNLISVYGHLRPDGSSGHQDWAEKGQGGMGGTPWQYQQRYVENSPVFYLDAVQTPLLIVHGLADWNSPPFVSDEVFVDLRRLGKQAEYVTYDGENHNILGYANQIDYCNRMIAWFDGHLRKQPHIQ